MITTEPASTKAILDFLRDVDDEEPLFVGAEDDLDSQPRPTDQTHRTVAVLGSVTVTGADGRRIELNSSGQRRLLAALAAAGGNTVRAELLGEMLGVGGSALRTAVSRLRARIGEDGIATDGLGYRLDVAVDALRFEQLLNRPGGGVDRLADLDAALGLWSGTAFDEFRHESWAEAEATRLDELRLVAAEDRAELLIALGRSGALGGRPVANLQQALQRRRPSDGSNINIRGGLQRMAVPCHPAGHTLNRCSPPSRRASYLRIWPSSSELIF